MAREGVRTPDYRGRWGVDRPRACSSIETKEHVLSEAADDRSGLDRLYERLDTEYQLVRAPAYAPLVVPQGGAGSAFHRWFHMKEAFSPNLLPTLLADLGVDADRPISILDPFLGSGTTAISALSLNRQADTRAAGIEVNPFLAHLSRATLQAMSLGKQQRIALADRVATAVPTAVRARPGRPPRPPALNAFMTTEYFPDGSLARLSRIRANILEMEPSLERDLLLVALAATVEPSSRLRRDGRALRYEPNKTTSDPTLAFVGRVQEMGHDLREVDVSGTGFALTASALDQCVWNDLGPGSWDLCVFSPPYPNNIDYTEVYKLEGWFLGFIEDQQQFRQQRKLTLRSHPSIMFDARADDANDLSSAASDGLNELLAILHNAIPSDRYRHQRRRMITGYLEDCASVFGHAYRALRPGGHLAYVVGNSRHGSGDESFTIASDVLLAEIARLVGFEVNRVTVARDLRRRGRSDHLRESVVTLMKPR